MARDRYDYYFDELTWGASRPGDLRVPADEHGTLRGYVLDCLDPERPITALQIMRSLNANARPGDRLYTQSMVAGYLQTLARKRIACWKPGGRWVLDPEWWAKCLAEAEAT